MFNNPFGCELGYTDDESNFEIFIGNDYAADPYEYLSVESVEALLIREIFMNPSTNDKMKKLINLIKSTIW